MEFPRAETEELAVMKEVDPAWLYAGAVIGLLLPVGQAMREAGLARPHATHEVLRTAFLTTCVGIVAFFALGFGFAFNEGSQFIGFCFTGCDVSGLGLANGVGLPQFLLLSSVSVAAVSVVRGAWTERVRSVSLMLVAFVYCALVFPLALRWTWSGWLQNTGFVDAAGGASLHMMGGFVALAGCKLIGPRVGRFARKRSPAKFMGHRSDPLTFFGSCLAWFAFAVVAGTLRTSGGLTLRAGTGGDLAVGRAITTTSVAAAAAGIVGQFVASMQSGPARLSAPLNGALGGIAMVASGCTVMEPWAGFVLGLFAGLLVPLGQILSRRLQADDVTDSFAVHGLCGFVGVLATGIFANPAYMGDNLGGAAYLGEGYYNSWEGEPNARLLGWQAFGAVVLLAWGVLTVSIVMGVLSMTGFARRSAQEEMTHFSEHEIAWRAFLDEHGEPTSPEEARAVYDHSDDTESVSLEGINTGFGVWGDKLIHARHRPGPPSSSSSESSTDETETVSTQSDSYADDDSSEEDSDAAEASELSDTSSEDSLATTSVETSGEEDTTSSEGPDDDVEDDDDTTTGAEAESSLTELNGEADDDDDEEEEEGTEGDATEGDATEGDATEGEDAAEDEYEYSYAYTNYAGSEEEEEEPVVEEKASKKDKSSKKDKKKDKKSSKK